MKFDDLLAQYLYETKTLHLQGIGTFHLEGKVSIPFEQDKEVYYPIEGLSFKHNTKEPLDESLVAFLVKKLGKIQPLVRSDLESYLSNVKQFINLGKPYTIEGVGTLHINNQGTYEFTPGNFLPVKEELNPKRENPDHNYSEKEKSSSVGKGLLVTLIVVASIAALAGLGWGVYTMVTSSNSGQAEVQTTDTLATENTQQPVVADTTASTPVVTTSPTDTAAYKMVFEVTRLRSRAVKRTAQLQTLNINAKYDSTGSGNDLQYRIYVTKNITANDTLRVRDSIARFFLRKVFVVKQ